MFQIRWMWKNTDVFYRWLYLLAIFICIVNNLALLINPMLTSRLVDEVIVAKNPQPLVGLLTAMLSVTVVRLGLHYFMIISMEKTSQNLTYNLRQSTFAVLQFQEMRFFDTHRTGDLMTRLSDDLNWCRHFVAYLVYFSLGSVIQFFSALILFFWISWKLTLCLLVVCPLLVLITRWYSKLVRPKFVDLRERLSHLNTAAQENIAGNRVVKAFAREEYEQQRFDRCNDEFREINLDINKTWLSFYPGIEMLANLLTIVTIFVGGLFIILGEITAGELSVFTALSWTISGPMRNLGAIVNDLHRVTTSAGKVIDLFYSRPLICDRTDAIPHPTMNGEITFDHVTFSHGDLPVLQDVSFTVKPGETLAIIGPTGSGKTTLIQLLARFYDVNEGRVLVDGCDVRNWRLRELRGRIGTATQDVFLFSDTVEGNIAFGDPDLSVEDAKKAAVIASADDFISKLDDGYDTIIGERGVGLSGGQRQRIALARAIAIKPSVLVLDDTTSALDMETEKYIQDQLQHLPFACTKIIIAQRISSVEHADQILVLRDGKIAEQGTHQQLLQNKGYYWDTYALQNDLAKGGVQ